MTILTINVIHVIASRGARAQAIRKPREEAPRMDDAASALPRLSEVSAIAVALRALRSGGHVAAPAATSFIRLARCIVLGQGSTLGVQAVASERYPGDAALNAYAKAAAAAGTLANASEISAYRQMTAEFVESSRPTSIVLNLINARRIPPRTRAARITSGATVGWVGEELAKPVTTLAFDSVVLQAHKLGAIVVVTDEVLRMSTPSADSVIRSDLIASVNFAVDSSFVSTTAGSASRPAGILNGVVAVASTGAAPAAVAKDLAAVVAGMVAAGGTLASPVLLLSPQTSLALGLQTTASSPTFPRSIVSSAVPADEIILVDESEVLLADDGSIELDTSEEASVMLDSAPVEGTTKYVSLWQSNLAAIRAERFISWAPARSAAATAGYISGYGA